MAHIDWAGAVTGVDVGHLSSSSGETRILRLAASLAGGVPVNLGDAVTGLDHTNIDLLVQVILHSAGHSPA